MSKPLLFSSPKLRTFACTIGVLIAATVVTGGAAVYLPFGEIDSIGIPILLFPVTWSVLFLLSALIKNIWHVFIFLSSTIAVHIFVIVSHLSGNM